jgi:16S rRNA G966 N2-methylase RsmD
MPPGAPSAPSRFPPTRYQGSKRKLAAAIVEHLSDLEFTTVLDAFGGTGAVGYAFKEIGKHVTCNDVLRFNHQVGVALIENDTTTLADEEIQAVGVRHADVAYADFIERTFAGIYFTDEENRWLDRAAANILRIPNAFKRALAWFALFQSALAKRPYNLFHRSNLYMRIADVPRSFGNKATWDRSFPEHFRRFARGANGAVIDGGGMCRATCADVMEVTAGFDLVYIDPPYVNRHGVGVDYQQFYHFLEGLVRYNEWPAMIDPTFKHRPLRRATGPWSDAKRCHGAFRAVFDRFRDSILVVSYRSDGTPTLDELAVMLGGVKRNVRMAPMCPYQYALSTNRASQEVLLIGTD